MRTFGIAIAALAFALSACAPEVSVEDEEPPQREFFVEPQEREPAGEPRAPEPPATAIATGSPVYQPPPPPPPDPVPDTAPEDEDPFYRPPGLDPCAENAYGFVDNDACLAQNGYPID